MAAPADSPDARGVAHSPEARPVAAHSPEARPVAADSPEASGLAAESPEARGLAAELPALLGDRTAVACAWVEALLSGPHDRRYETARARDGHAYLAAGVAQPALLALVSAVRKRLPDTEALHARLDADLAIFLETYRQDVLAKALATERLATLGQLAASIGHELRNPLSVVESSVFLLEQRLAALAIDDAKLHKHLEKISAEVFRANKTISDVLELARSQPIRREPLAATALVARALTEARLPLEIDVVLALPDDLEVRGDRDGLVRVLCNLLVNASQAMSGKGRIFIEGDHGAWLRVRDEGPGVPAVVRPRLFEVLFTTKTNGHGLGLALSRRIAEAHGGSLELEAGDRGASFVLRIPEIRD